MRAHTHARTHTHAHIHTHTQIHTVTVYTYNALYVVDQSTFITVGIVITSYYGDLASYTMGANA